MKTQNVTQQKILKNIILKIIYIIVMKNVIILDVMNIHKKKIAHHVLKIIPYMEKYVTPMKIQENKHV